MVQSSLKKDSYWLTFFILAGFILRLIWTADMEWKLDERELFESALRFARGELPWPWIGVKSGVGLTNPGFSFWPFILFAKFSPDPIGVVHWIQGMNILAILGFLLLLYKKIPASQRAVWLWGTALFCVSPLPILFARKIWIQNILPPFCVVLLWGHFYRDRFAGAFFWGLLAALIGQIHMSGFFWAPALFVATFYKHRKEKTLGKGIAWPGFIMGTLLGLAPALPWLLTLAHGNGVAPEKSLSEVFSLRFYSHWFGNAWGVYLLYVLKDVYWSKFLREPLWASYPSFGVFLAQLFLFGTGVYATIRSWRQRGPFSPDKNLRFYILAAALGAGALLQLTGLRVHAHYLIIFFPFVHLWAAALLIHNKKLLKATLLAQLLTSLCFLIYIHREGGVTRGPAGIYGAAYRLYNYKVPAVRKDH